MISLRNSPNFSQQLSNFNMNLPRKFFVLFPSTKIKIGADREALAPSIVLLIIPSLPLIDLREFRDTLVLVNKGKTYSIFTL